MHSNDILTIGEVARRTDIAVSAIRHYEEMGLIHPMRAPSGQRRFRRADIRRLSFIRIAQQFGFTLPRIGKELSNLPNNRAPNARDWKRISAGFHREISEKIAALERLRDDLDGCIGCGCLSMDRCALYNRNDEAAANGGGPRYLLGDKPG